ncbi:hypothetical protein NMG60_11016755 [Bertholletia excelsa]
MAFTRLLSLPFASSFSTQQLQLFSQATLPPTSPKAPPLNSILYPHPSSCSLSTSSPRPFLALYTDNTKGIPFLCRASFSSQGHTTIETPELEDIKLGVQEEASEDEEEEEEDEASRTRVLAQNVPWTSTADDLRPLFEKYGTVVNIELSMHNKTRNRGLAFVTMSSHEEALAALNNLDSYEFEGRALKLNWARPKRKKHPPFGQPMRAPVHNLFVGNLSYQARSKDLKEFFSSENVNAVSAEIIYLDNPRRSAGYGFVSFNTKEEADAALSAFQGKMFMGRPLRVGHSRRFLRPETKASIQSTTGSSEFSSSTEQLKETNAA